MAETKTLILGLIACMLLQSVAFAQESSCGNVDNMRDNERIIIFSFNDQKSEAVPKSIEAGPFQKIGNSYYLIETQQSVSWFKAAHICSSYKAHLVSIETAYEMNMLSNYLVSSNYRQKQFWTSGNDLVREGLFQWLGTGHNFAYSKWLPPQPDNAGNNENCVHLWVTTGNAFSFNDRNCKNQIQYICEINSE